MTLPPLEEVKAAHRLLAEYKYDLQPVERGYANRTLYVNLSENEIREKSVTSQMKEIFTGGRGFALWLLWNAVDGDTHVGTTLKTNLSSQAVLLVESQRTPALANQRWSRSHHLHTRCSTATLEATSVLTSNSQAGTRSRSKGKRRGM